MTAIIVGKRLSDEDHSHPKQKKDQLSFSWPSMGINYPANRPDPDTPGGWGLRNPERKDRANAGSICDNPAGRSLGRSGAVL
jgi:hypothetical protein